MEQITKEARTVDKKYREAAKKGFESKRLVMRPFRQSDINDFFEYAKNPEVGPNAGRKPHETKLDTQKILDIFMGNKGDIIFAPELKENGKVIGSVGLGGDEKRALPDCLEAGYVLSRDYWGRGLMTEAVRAALKFGFEELGLSMISVGHFPGNLRSKRVIEKCGFKYEGTIRKAYELFDGSFVDECIYSITKEEFARAMENEKLTFNF